MNSLATEEIRDNIGEFIDRRIRLPNGDPIPRNIPYFKQALSMMLEIGLYDSSKEIVAACLREEHQIIPDFLFEK